MSRSSVSVVPRNVVTMAFAGLAVALLGGCSSDVTRFSDPYSNPFNTASADTTPTGSFVPPPAPVASVQSQPLAPPRAVAPSYAAPPVRASAAEPLPAGPAGWSTVGGTPVVVGQGDTIAVLSGRYGVPAQALLHTNGFTAGSQVAPGTRLIIPVYRAEGARVAERPDRVERAADAERPPRRPKVEEAAADVPKTKAERLAEAEKIKKAKAERLAKLDREHGKIKEAAAASDAEAPKPLKAKPVAPLKVAELPKKGAEAPVRAAANAPAGTDTMTTASLPPAPVADKPEFRWPARGRVILGFKPGSNDGINIALPDHTPVKAAEAGVVAYAGSELKGYGNMVLIKHPNGYVTAYANNGELDVKKGDQVKRGQIIAKSGQTGNVTAPQLHFELRKGSTPVDPAAYLAGL
jgi:murein DD-endopeptidase MepM/ murein hydrolase activator NlpD